LIIYFNINAYNIAQQNKIINVLSSSGECDYRDIDSIPDKQICTLDPYKNDFYFTTDNFTYIVATNSTNYLNICQSLCSQGSDKNVPCQGTQEEINKFNLCSNELKPAAACKGFEKPLAYRLDSNTGEKVYYYAKEIIKDSQCYN
jgi:hypothetical protein